MKRCAIYTRKSSSEGLEQDFNSLDAQREACVAYVHSQAGEGWRVLAEHYDDGGFSGGTIERPGLKRLLRDVAAKKIDIVVVYKIDRLTRSLADFARIVETFDAREVSFVSVTQSFNTTSSMGRLTLNVLLSFAQFEREVTGERIRDKIAASKAKGMWMGGCVPLGYDAPADSERKLIVNEAEAETVRLIFERYLELGTVQKLHAELNASGVRPKQRVTAAGKEFGAVRFSRTSLFHLLKNQIYLGRIVHRERSFNGRHAAIISKDLFERCQRKLKGCTERRRRNTKARAPLTGKIFSDVGERLTPTFSIGRSGRRYRYYAPIAPNQNSIRLPAQAIERFVNTHFAKIGLAGGANADEFTKVIVGPYRTDIIVDGKFIDRVSAAAQESETVDQTEDDFVVWSIPTRWSKACTIASTTCQRPMRDEKLIMALRRSHGWLKTDNSGLPTFSDLPCGCYERRILKLAFLAPTIQADILAGRQPTGLSLERIVRGSLPLDWDEQVEWIKALSSAA